MDDNGLYRCTVKKNWALTWQTQFHKPVPMTYHKRMGFKSSMGIIGQTPHYNCNHHKKFASMGRVPFVYMNRMNKSKGFFGSVKLHLEKTMTLRIDSYKKCVESTN